MTCIPYGPWHIQVWCQPRLGKLLDDLAEAVPEVQIFEHGKHHNIIPQHYMYLYHHVYIYTYMYMICINTSVVCVCMLSNHIYIHYHDIYIYVYTHIIGMYVIYIYIYIHDLGAAIPPKMADLRILSRMIPIHGNRWSHLPRCGANLWSRGILHFDS